MANAKKAAEITLTFEYEKDTKNTRKYQEVPNENGVTFVGSLYVQKSAAIALGTLPESLTVTIRPAS